MYPPWPHQPPAERLAADPEATQPWTPPWADPDAGAAMAHADVWVRPQNIPPRWTLAAPVTVRARRRLLVWLTWPATVRAMKRVGMRRVGWMTWQAGPPGGGP